MRLGSQTERRFGPTPFSTEWNVAPPLPERPRRVPIRPDWLPAVLPSWFPSERTLSAFLVIVLVLTTVAFSTGSNTSLRDTSRSSEDRVLAGASQTTDTDRANTTSFAGPVADAGAVEQATGTDSPSDDAASVESGIGSSDPQPASETSNQPDNAAAAADIDEQDTSGQSAESALPPSNDDTLEVTGDTASDDTSASTDDPAELVAANQSQDAFVLPEYRIVAIYGHPHDPNMGLLGEQPLDELYDVLMEHVAMWEEADPGRPVMPAFEIIATVAQGEPQIDGTFLLDTDFETLIEYIEFAQERDVMVFLDVQVGRRGVEAEVERLFPLLEYPNVHLAIDPEFSIEEGQVPGIHYGDVDASQITWTQNTLVEFTTERDLPPKMLIVHQFTYDMIENKDQLAPVPGVQLIIHADGWGAPELKAETYGVVITQQLVEFNGFKLFYPKPNWSADTPMMTPKDVLALDPPPDVITYQ